MAVDEDYKFEHTDMHKSYLLVTYDSAGMTISTQKSNADKPGAMVYMDHDEAEAMYEALGRMLGQ